MRTSKRRALKIQTEAVGSKRKRMLEGSTLAKVHPEGEDSSGGGISGTRHPHLVD